jgi:hypothetical protein
MKKDRPHSLGIRLYAFAGAVLIAGTVALCGQVRAQSSITGPNSGESVSGTLWRFTGAV